MTDSAAFRIAESATPTTPSPTPAKPTPGKPAPAKDKPRHRLVLERFLRHRLAVVGLLTLVALAISCFGAHWIAPYPHNRQDLLLGAQQPSSEHWLGTDSLGRDYLSELLFAGQVSLAIGICVALLSTLVGTAVGAIAGFAGGRPDEVIMRVTDLFLIVPAIAVLALALEALGPSPVTIVLILSALGWTMIARVVRSQVLTLRNRSSSRPPGSSAPPTRGSSSATCCPT